MLWKSPPVYSWKKSVAIGSILYTSNNDKEVKNDNEKETENISKTALQFKCDMCDYINISEKELNQHKRMKHKDFEILRKFSNYFRCRGRTGHGWSKHVGY